jgi:hypothetical protein
MVRGYVSWALCRTHGRHTLCLNHGAGDGMPMAGTRLHSPGAASGEVGDWDLILGVGRFRLAGSGGIVGWLGS